MAALSRNTLEFRMVAAPRRGRESSLAATRPTSRFHATRSLEATSRHRPEDSPVRPIQTSSTRSREPWRRPSASRTCNVLRISRSRVANGDLEHDLKITFLREFASPCSHDDDRSPSRPMASSRSRQNFTALFTSSLFLSFSSSLPLSFSPSMRLIIAERTNFTLNTTSH